MIKTLIEVINLTPFHNIIYCLFASVADSLAESWWKDVPDLSQTRVACIFTGSPSIAGGRLEAMKG